MTSKMLLETDRHSASRPSWLDGGIEALEMVKEDEARALSVPPQLIREFMRYLMALRTSDYRDRGTHGIRVGRCLGFASALHEAGIITMDQYFQLDNLTLNVSFHAGERLPSSLNAGPVMPVGVRLKLQSQAVKLPARVPADEQQVPAPASRPELRLLCLLVKTRTGETRSIPVHTMRPMPPAVLHLGRWSLATDPAFVLRETHAVRSASEVLARYSRQRQTNAVCADSRTVRTGGVSYVR